MTSTRGWTLQQKLEFHSRDAAGGCREWTAALIGSGYGALWWKGKQKYAHRLVWEDANGPIPTGLFVCHRCDNPLCINLAHLFLGTPAENSADRNRKGRQARNRGERAGGVKLTAGQVLAIREDRRTQREISAEYGVSQGHVSRIRLRHEWGHITGVTPDVTAGS